MLPAHAFDVLCVDGRHEKAIGGGASVDLRGTHLIRGEFVRRACINGQSLVVCRVAVIPRILTGIRIKRR